MRGQDCKRIVIIGSSGAGKSYAAKALGQLTGYPVSHLDNLYWQPGWQPVAGEEFVRLQKELTSGPHWIVDGNYGGTLELRYRTADLVIHLDFSPALCILRVLRRHGTKRSDLPDYLEEAFSWELVGFFRDILRFRGKYRPRLANLRERYPQTALATVKSRREWRKFLEDWEAGREIV